jgi:hypothetical protein
MKKTIFAALVLSLICGRAYCQNAPAPNPVDPAIINQLVGIWTNELQSTLTISAIDHTTGQISGTYKITADPNTDYPLMGWVNTKPAGNTNNDHQAVVSFSVRWGQAGSVTSWNGNFTTNNNSPVLIENWFLSVPNSSAIYNHVSVGQDQFYRAK